MERRSPPADFTLPPGATVVVTGQQVGLLTGPLLTLLKAARAISHAAELSARIAAPAAPDDSSCPTGAARGGGGSPRVLPLFWAAADDHDLAEIHHTYLLNKQDDAQKLRLDLPVESGTASELEVPTDSAMALIETFFDAACIDRDRFSSAPFLPQRGDTLSIWFGRCLAAVLGRHAPRMVVPAELNRAARPVYEQALRDDGAIGAALQAGAAANQAAGIAAPLPIDPDPPLFVIDGLSRTRVRRTARPGEFLVGERTLSRQALLDLAHGGNPRLSANVALRTIVQAATLPCVAYVAGPTEILYYRQLEPLHRLFSVPFPKLVPRPHATLLTTAAARSARKLGVDPSALLQALADREGGVPAAAADDPLLRRGERLRTDVAGWLAELQSGRPAVRSAAERRATQLLQSFDLVLERARATLAEGAQVDGARWSTLAKIVRPKGKPQERVLNVLPFLAERGPELIEQLLALRGEPDAAGVVPYAVL
jgi:uncharacterized protein YllA (UPF0747 family)